MPDGWAAVYGKLSVLKMIYEAIHKLDFSLEQKTQYHNQYVRLLLDIWTTFEAKECSIDGAIRRIGDFGSLTILDKTVRTIIALGVNAKCYAGRTAHAFADLTAFMPIIRMTNGSRVAENKEIIKIITQLGKYPDMHRHRAIAMNEWIRLMLQLNIDDAKEYLTDALKQGWYENHEDLEEEAKSYFL